MTQTSLTLECRGLANIRGVQRTQFSPRLLRAATTSRYRYINRLRRDSRHSPPSGSRRSVLHHSIGTLPSSTMGLHCIFGSTISRDDSQWSIHCIFRSSSDHVDSRCVLHCIFRSPIIHDDSRLDLHCIFRSSISSIRHIDSRWDLHSIFRSAIDPTPPTLAKLTQSES